MKNQYLGITDLLDQDLACYEYFFSRPPEVRERVFAKDVASFAEMQAYVRRLRDPE